MKALSDAPSLPDLLDDGKIAAVVLDGSGTLLEVTLGAAALLGQEPAALIGGRLGDIAAEGWEWAVKNALMRMTSGSTDPFELLLVGRSGRRTLIQMIPRRLARTGSNFVVLWREQAHRVAGPPLTSSEAELRRLAYGLLKTHEAERGRVATELHDRVAPPVTMAKFMVEDALGRLDREAQREIASLLMTTVECLREALGEVRRISTDLHPSSLRDLGLLPTIEWFARRFMEAYPELQVDLQLRANESAICEELRLDVFRIVEEALINAGRHAHASRVLVCLHELPGRVQLRIEDNGVGFDTRRLAHGDSNLLGLGLRSLSKRVDATHGTLVIESNPKSGTSIIVTWPAETAAGRIVQPQAAAALKSG